MGFGLPPRAEEAPLARRALLLLLPLLLLPLPLLLLPLLLLLLLLLFLLIAKHMRLCKRASISRLRVRTV